LRPNISQVPQIGLVTEERTAPDTSHAKNDPKTALNELSADVQNGSFHGAYVSHLLRIDAVMDPGSGECLETIGEHALRELEGGSSPDGRGKAQEASHKVLRRSEFPPQGKLWARL
jgi:hypothetical protein